MVNVYVVVVYDVQKGRTELFKKFCRSKLNHVQNSVFEGQVTEAMVNDIEQSLRSMSKEDENIIIYKSWSIEYLDRTVIGTDPTPQDSHIL